MRAGLYVHIPFCIRKCHYCSFNSIPYEVSAARRYASALVSEIDGCTHRVQPSSLYIGGGTPTVLPAESLYGLLRTTGNRFELPPGIEATLEANPGTLAGIDFGGLMALGVNRVSLGAQSFNPSELAMLGRLHGPEEVERAVTRLKSSGISNISLDLMYSLPGQDMGFWLESLRRAVGLGVQHLSLYDLSLDVGTMLYSEVKSGRLALPPEPMQVDMYLLAVETLEKAGFARYEISNFALPGFECVHNMNYWSGGDYIGFGAGAHSHVSGTRTANLPAVEDYIEAIEKGHTPVGETEVLTKAEGEREFIMLGLRKAEGMRLDEYNKRFGRDFMESHGETAKRLEITGHMLTTDGAARLTLKGVLASSAVIREFF